MVGYYDAICLSFMRTMRVSDGIYLAGMDKTAVKVWNFYHHKYSQGRNCYTYEVTYDTQN